MARHATCGHSEVPAQAASGSHVWVCGCAAMGISINEHPHVSTGEHGDVPGQDSCRDHIDVQGLCIAGHAPHWMLWHSVELALCLDPDITVELVLLVGSEPTPGA